MTEAAVDVRAATRVLTDERLLAAIDYLLERGQRGSLQDEEDAVEQSVILMGEHWNLLNYEEEDDAARSTRESLPAQLPLEAQLSVLSSPTFPLDWLLEALQLILSEPQYPLSKDIADGRLLIADYSSLLPHEGRLLALELRDSLVADGDLREYLG